MTAEEYAGEDDSTIHREYVMAKWLWGACPGLRQIAQRVFTSVRDDLRSEAPRLRTMVVTPTDGKDFEEALIDAVAHIMTPGSAARLAAAAAASPTVHAVSGLPERAPCLLVGVGSMNSAAR